MWYLKQLLPLRYESTYQVNDGRWVHSTWRMWGGRVFQIKTYRLAGPPGGAKDRFDQCDVIIHAEGE